MVKDNKDGIMDKDKVAIKKIEIDLGGKTISLTPAQAKKLNDVLGELYGKEVVREHHHHDHYPIRTYPWSYWGWDNRTVTCDSGTMQFEAGTVTCSLT